MSQNRIVAQPVPLEIMKAIQSLRATSAAQQSLLADLVSKKKDDDICLDDKGSEFSEESESTTDNNPSRDWRSITNSRPSTPSQVGVNLQDTNPYPGCGSGTVKVPGDSPECL